MKPKSHSLFFAMELTFLLWLVAPVMAQAARIKDIATLKGARNNQLLGYGLVVGLSGTGDKSNELTENSLSLILKNMGIDLKSKKLETKNAAAVICSATLPPFTKTGSNLDVTVSAVGGASSLDGGQLLATALRGPDGQVYALAQGKIVTIKRGDAGAKATGQSNVTAQVPGGAILEREVIFDFSKQKELRYHLLSPDFTTAARMARRINDELGGRYAVAADAGTIDVILPYSLDTTPVELVAQIERIDIEADRRARIIVNPRSGTVVMGEHVRIAPVAVAHNNLQLEIKPEPGKQGEAQTQKVVLMSQGPTIADVVASLNQVGASSDDLISLIQSLKAAGALLADVEIQ